MAVALLLMLSAVTACRFFPVHPERAAITAATSFVLRSVFDLQSRVPLTQNSVRPALQATAEPATPCTRKKESTPKVLVVANYSDGQLVITRVRTL
jgi:hypothetical protein